MDRSLSTTQFTTWRHNESYQKLFDDCEMVGLNRGNLFSCSEKPDVTGPLGKEINVKAIIFALFVVKTFNNNYD